MVTLESGLGATVSDFDNAIDTDLSQDEKEFWLNVAYDFLVDRLDWSEFRPAKKKRMEAIAAADAATAEDPRVTSERIADREKSYQRDSSQTDHWQMLVAMDHTGKLASDKNAPTASFETFGPGRD